MNHLNHLNIAKRQADLLMVSEVKISPSELRRWIIEQTPPGHRPRHAPAIPLGLLVARATASLRGLRGERWTVRRVARAESLIPAVVGEAIDCVARVKYWCADGEFATLAVELRRRRGPVLARFELGGELKRPSATPDRFARAA